jgi:hypothetical protein
MQGLTCAKASYRLAEKVSGIVDKTVQKCSVKEVCNLCLKMTMQR